MFVLMPAMSHAALPGCGRDNDGDQQTDGGVIYECKQNPVTLVWYWDVVGYQGLAFAPHPNADGVGGSILPCTIGELEFAGSDALPPMGQRAIGRGRRLHGMLRRNDHMRYAER